MSSVNALYSPNRLKIHYSAKSSDRVLGFEQHFIRGMAKMEMRVTLALVIMLAMAKRRILANQADLMRSMM